MFEHVETIFRRYFRSLKSESPRIEITTNDGYPAMIPSKMLQNSYSLSKTNNVFKLTHVV